MADDFYKAARVRLNEQAALLLHADKLINDKPISVNPVATPPPGGPLRARTGKRIDEVYENFCFYRSTNAGGGHINITNQLFRNKNINYLLRELPPHILSGIVPTIKLYKVFIEKEYLGAGNKTFKTNSWRVPFDDIPFKYNAETSKFVEKSLDELVAGNGRMNNIGIKSFRYKYVGTNPAEINTNIEAELEIFFQNVKDLVNEIDILPGDPNYQISKNPSVYTKKFAYIDLAVDSALKIPSTVDPSVLLYNPNYFRIKAIIGYAEPNDNYLADLIPDINTRQDVKDALETAKIILYLNPYNHDISFEEDGRIILKIKYIAAMTAALANIDAFSATAGSVTTKAYRELLNLQERFEQLSSQTRSNLEKIKKGCGPASGYDEKAQKEIFEKEEKLARSTLLQKRSELENQKWKVYSNLFSDIVGANNPTGPGARFSKFLGRLYEVDIPKTDFGEPLSTGTTLGATDNPTQIRLQNLGLNAIRGYDLTNLTATEKTNFGLTAGLPTVTTPTTLTGKPDPDSDKLALKVNIETTEKTVNKEFTATPSDPNYYKVKFVYLGDIINYFASSINLSIPDPVERPRLILGDFNIEIPNRLTRTNVAAYDTDTSYREVQLSIPDIPISINMLQSFFLEKIVKPAREKYPLINLINDLILYLVFPAMTPTLFGRNADLNRAIRLSTLNISLPFDASTGNDVITNSPNTNPFGGKEISPANLANLRTHTKIKTNMDVSEIGNYLLFYCSNQLPRVIIDSNGDIGKDESNGVYHFFIGSDTGIIKKVNFSRTETPFYKEAKAYGSTGASNLGRLREVYDCSITMFGNNIYRPGDYIYIEPLFFTGPTAFDLQTKLGLGGYYQVIDVETTVSDQDYQTVLNTVLSGYIQLEPKEVIDVGRRTAC